MTSVHFPDCGSGSPPQTTLAGLDGPREPIQSSESVSAAVQRSWPPPASKTTFAPDLTYSHRILDAIEDMHNQHDVGALLSAVADHGTTIIPADGIALLEGATNGWRPAFIRAVSDKSDGVDQAVELLTAEGWFQHVNRVDDLSQDQRWGQLPLPSSVRTWRSLLIVASDRQNHAHAPVTFVWWSHPTAAFTDQTDIAALFARTASLAIHNVNTRHNLAQAVLARHRAGLAQGILMSRLGCSQDHAMAILKYPIAAHQPETSDYRW